MMKVDHLGWAGMKLGRFVLDEQLGAGAFSYVYSATEEASGRKRVLKFAKTVASDEDGLPGSTRAMMFGTGCIHYVEPDVVALLQNQCEKLRWHPDSALPFVDEIIEQNGFWFYRMELIEGETMRQQMARSLKLSHHQLLELFSKLCTGLSDLLDRGTFVYHGDLKPENILISNGGIRLIDPGYFGALDTNMGTIDPCIISTPAYYPFLEADDIFAVGLIMWEAFCGKHPFEGYKTMRVSDYEPSLVDEQLAQFIKIKNAAGYPFAVPLLTVPPPSDFDPRISHPLEQLLLKAVRLRFNMEGVREMVPGFESFEELNEAIESVMMQL